MEKALVDLTTVFSKLAGTLTLLAAGVSGLTYATANLLTPSTAKVRADLTPPAPKVPALNSTKKVKRRSKLLAGIASWYGEVLEGHTTASGEIFHKDKLTACHPTLPFGTLVRVINLRNRKSVVVRINDRGVLNPDRVIDLSSRAAEEIGMLRAGVAPVRLEVVAAHG